jgi:hypothetical protein
LDQIAQGEVVERDGQPLAGRHLDRQLIVASPDVLHERMADNDDPGATVLLKSSHRSQPCLQAAVIGLDPGIAPCRITGLPASLVASTPEGDIPPSSMSRRC